jgi:hypothetical protein
MEPSSKWKYGKEGRMEKIGAEWMREGKVGDLKDVKVKRLYIVL